MRHFTILPDSQNTNGFLQSLVRSLHIWERSRDVFLRNWKTETGGIVVEPLLVLTAVGFGLGSYMADIQGRRLGGAVRRNGVVPESVVAPLLVVISYNTEENASETFVFYAT